VELGKVFLMEVIRWGSLLVMKTGGGEILSNLKRELRVWSDQELYGRESS
jgi:hypothetical protein